ADPGGQARAAAHGGPGVPLQARRRGGGRGRRGDARGGAVRPRRARARGRRRRARRGAGASRHTGVGIRLPCAGGCAARGPGGRRDGGAQFASRGPAERTAERVGAQHAAPLPRVRRACYFAATCTSICRGLAFSTFGRVTVRTPFSYVALMLLASTVVGSVKLRSNAP